MDAHTDPIELYSSFKSSFIVARSIYSKPKSAIPFKSKAFQNPMRMRSKHMQSHMPKTARMIQTSHARALLKSKSQSPSPIWLSHKAPLYLRIASARETVTGRILVDRPAGNIETETTHASPDTDDQHVQDGQADLSWGREPPAPVDVQPVHTTQAVTEPAGEE